MRPPSSHMQRLLSQLARLPGVGEKTAQRYLLFLLTSDHEIAKALGSALCTLHEHLVPCVRCGNIAEVSSAEQENLCPICLDNKRDASLLCIVGRVQDLMAIERTGVWRGRYFVLGKLLSPLEGIRVEDLPLQKLKQRVEQDGVVEILLATPPSVEGEATALLIKRELSPSSICLTRIASGIPHGGDLEFADPITMGRALAGRQRL